MVQTHTEDHLLDKDTTLTTEGQDVLTTPSPRKKGKKGFVLAGVQAYYTGESLAQHIGVFLALYFKAHMPTFTRTLDLCAGSGRLTRALLDAVAGQVDLTMHFVEPEHAACDVLLETMRQQHGDQMDVRVHEMSCEEYCTTYADERSVELVLCNPPFGRRLGRSQLGEELRSMHLADVADFEPYFLHVASLLARNLCVFLILPTPWSRRSCSLS